jgi:fructosamine-3-kinase
MDKIDLDEVLALLSNALGEKVIVDTQRLLGGGCINHASRLSTNKGDFFLKWNDTCETDMFLREADSLEELRKAASGELIVPRTYAAKKVDETPGFLVLEYLRPGYERSGNDEKLGRGLALLHQCKGQQFGFHHNNYCGATPQNNDWNDNWAVFFRDKRLSYLLLLIEKKYPLSTAERKIYDNLLNRIERLVPADVSPVLIHGDLWSGNYMISDKGPALIDPAAYYADCEMEFAIMTMFGGFSPAFYSAYFEVNPLRNDWKNRNGLYQLYHILNHYYLFGGGYSSQAINVAKSYL